MSVGPGSVEASSDWDEIRRNLNLLDPNFPNMADHFRVSDLRILLSHGYRRLEDLKRTTLEDLRRAGLPQARRVNLTDGRSELLPVTHSLVLWACLLSQSSYSHVAENNCCLQE